MRKMGENEEEEAEEEKKTDMDAEERCERGRI